MKHFFFSLLLVFLISFQIGCSSSSQTAKEFIGQEAPYTRFTMLDGSTKLLEEYKGKKLVLLFWATWCHVSRPEIEDLNEFAAKFANKNDVVFLAVSVDELDAYEKLKEKN